jgi:hypothetical protein
MARRADGDCNYLDADPPLHGVRAAARHLPPAPTDQEPAAGLVRLRGQGAGALKDCPQRFLGLQRITGAW